MQATISLEQRFERTPDGCVWAAGAFSSAFWAPYLSVFARVRVIARLCDVREPSPMSTDVSHRDVAFAPVCYYVGPLRYAICARRVITACRRYSDSGGAYILRVPSVVGGHLAARLTRRRHPYGVEVVADPYDVFAPGTLSHPLRPAFRRLATRALVQQCRDASAAAYVTATALQRRYPCRGRSFSVSDVILDEEAFRPAERIFSRPASHIVFVGSLDQLYKGPDVLLAAVAQLVASGMSFSLSIVGDGKYRRDLQGSRAAQRLGARVRFLGALPPGRPVRDVLDSSDIFVLPSRTEGLPRAMIEAMARGLPCIGSRVGGIPELLPAQHLVTAGDSNELAIALRRIACSIPDLNAASRRNLQRAKQFAVDITMSRRRDFFRYLADETKSRGTL